LLVLYDLDLAFRSQDFQFFPPELAMLQEREMAVHKRLNGIPAVAREPQGPEDTPDKLEEEQLIAQEFINIGKSLPIGQALC
jgi:SWI/SNF-related matrix-associated actin-dependent regulator of chromatin subfamily A member 5